MKWHRTTAVLASFLLVMTSALAADPFPLKTAGGDPCNPKAGCTLTWALEQSKWPQEVQAALIEKVRAQPRGKEYIIPLEYRLWMTAGMHHRKFWPGAITRWKEGPQPSIFWSVRHDGVDYFLFNVNVCKNWAGSTRKVAAQQSPGAGSAPAAAASAPFRAASAPEVDPQITALIETPFVNCN